MRFEILKPSGYCAGVTRAIDIALKAKEEQKGRNVYVLGMLVHNNDVINYLLSKGIKSVESLDKVENGSAIILSAHGHSEEIYNSCLKKNLVIYDATCPKVNLNIEIIKNANLTNRDIIYIGHKNHRETLAALSYSKNMYFYDVKEGFSTKPNKSSSPLVINQTTLNIKEIADIHNLIISEFPKAEVQNEICNATRLRQEAIINSKDFDAYIVVGDIKSSNTNRLFEIAKAYHPNVYSIMVSSFAEIDQKALINKKHIGIIGGASTPNKSIDVILDKLNELFK